MKKKWVIMICIIIIVLVVCFLFLNKKREEWYIIDWTWMVNEVSSYKVVTWNRWNMVGEDVFVYDEDDNLILSLDDKNQPQYFFALYGNYLILDSGTSASRREMLVYDILTWKVIYRTDYYPWENWLVLNNDNVIFYKEITPQTLFWDYTLPDCESEYHNGYIENYWYTIWEDQANDLGDLQCAYFE